MINGAEASPKEKWLIIKPNESDFRVINLKGIYNTIKNYSFTVNGLYKVNTNGIVGAAPNFKLPASQNEFKVADFICTLSDLVKETGKTKAKFTCVYSGSKIGFIDPKKVTVKMPDGNEYSNTNISTSLLSKSPDAPMMLMNGTQENFTLIWERMQGGRAMDMQKVDMIIIWHEAFSQSTLKKINGETLQFEFDETTSNLKGK